MTNYDLIIIGAGAAGSFAAGLAAKRGLSVLLLERNPKIGRKLLITGKGRCNVTNNCDVRDCIAHVRTNPRFLYSAFSAFSPADTMAFFENAGVPLKTERGNRVFPQSDKAMDIVDALYRHISHPNITLKHEPVTELLVENGAVCGVKTERTTYTGKNVLLATGGKSYPLTGSDGLGYRIAQQCGHTIIDTQPSLIPIVTEDVRFTTLQGLSLKNVTLSLFCGDSSKPLFSELGEMLFTHFGISGPLVLSASSYMDRNRLPQYRLVLDMKPALDHKQLDARLLRDFEKYANRHLQNALDDLLPKRMIPVFIDLCGLSPELKVNQITKEQRLTLVNTLKAIPITPRAFRPITEAIITAGGVSVKEIDPKTMQSKVVSGLYFAGEIIDVDAFTGGYNLQIAFSTAYLAVNSL